MEARPSSASSRRAGRRTGRGTCETGRQRGRATPSAVGCCGRTCRSSCLSGSGSSTSPEAAISRRAMLSLYDPPPFIGGCSQAFFPHGEPLLVRNYDYHPSLFEAVVLASRLTGRAVLGTSDCVWGLLDGVNDAGLAVSFGFGGRRAVADGFCITLAVRYLLELCETAGEAAERLARLPVQLSYNVALVDAAGRRLTVFVAPDRPARIEPIDASTNHQGEVEWPEYAKVTRSVERLERLRRLLDEPSLTRARLVGAFLRPRFTAIATRRASGRCTRACTARPPAPSSTAGPDRDGGSRSRRSSRGSTRSASRPSMREPRRCGGWPKPSRRRASRRRPLRASPDRPRRRRRAERRG